MDDQQTPPLSLPPVIKRTFLEKLVEYCVLGLMTILIIVGTWCKDSVLDWLHTSHDNSPTTIAREAARDREIYDILVELRTQYQADRALICLFHNGEYWTTGEPIRKMSASHEAARIGVSRITDRIRMLSLSQVPDLMQCLAVKQQPVYSVIAQMPEAGYRDLLLSQGVGATLTRPLRLNGNSDQFVGVVMLHWLQPPQTPASPVLTSLEPSLALATSRIEFLLAKSP